jgi:hypothetical protein
MALMYAGFVARDTWACVFYDACRKVLKVCRCLIKGHLVFEEFNSVQEIVEYYGDAYTPSEDIPIEYPEEYENPIFTSEEEITTEGAVPYIGFIPGDPGKDFKCVFFDRQTKTILVCMCIEKGRTCFKEYKSLSAFMRDFGDRFKDDMPPDIEREVKNLP